MLAKVNDIGDEIVVTEEKFLELCRAGKHQEIESLLKQLPSKKIDELIHAKKDYAFCISAEQGHINILKLLLKYTPDLVLRNMMIHTTLDTGHWRPGYNMENVCRYNEIL